MPIYNPPGPRPRQFFVPMLYTSVATSTKANSSWGFDLPDSANHWAWGWDMVPSFYLSDLSAAVVVLAAGSGDVYVYSRITLCAAGESPNTREVEVGFSTVSISFEQQAHILPATFSGVSVSPGDIIRCQFRREGTNVADTLSVDLNVTGVLFSCTADM